jgi:flagellar hook protein FlgE
MSIISSMSSGTSSLQANQKRLDIISNNIANVNTIGFKSSRANFSDEFNQVFSYGKTPDNVAGNGTGGINPEQIGLGVKLSSITQNMNEGTIDSTGRNLDLALQGDGFFIYNYNGEQDYSRAGSISQDKNGNFVDTNTGAFLQGYNLQTDSNGRIIKDANGVNQLQSKLSNLAVNQSVSSPPKQTENVTLTGNLNSTSPTGFAKQTSITIFDDQGASHNLNLTFTKTANANEFAVGATIDGTTVNTSAANVTFNNDGTINTPLSLVMTGANLNTAIPAFNTTKNLNIQLADAGSLTTGLTQYSGPNSATASTQDGYQTGSLQATTVDEQGKIWGAFTNGQSEVLGQVAIAQFDNAEGLTKDGNSFYTTSSNSGLPKIGTAGDIFANTTVASGSLEQSNVDLSEEFTDMIATQRAYEAASRVITTADMILSIVNQIKR